MDAARRRRHTTPTGAAGPLLPNPSSNGTEHVLARGNLAILVGGTSCCCWDPFESPVLSCTLLYRSRYLLCLSTDQNQKASLLIQKHVYFLLCCLCNVFACNDLDRWRGIASRWPMSDRNAAREERTREGMAKMKDVVSLAR